MITASFISDPSGKHYEGFSVSGHSGYSEAGTDIVCSAVSSAVMLTVNAICESFGIEAGVCEKEGSLSLSVKAPSADSDSLIDALKEHLKVLSEDYPENVNITLTSKNAPNSLD